MRKTSQDGGDTTSTTSIVENELKKPGTKTKKTSVKRKINNYSNESDETVKEPLLQGEANESKTKDDKHISAKMKTDSNNEEEIHTDNIISVVNTKKCVTSTYMQGTSGDILPSPHATKVNSTKCYVDATAPLHNHMNTNIFSDSGSFVELVTSKTHILVEIDETKKSGCIPTPLIFTTAKIQTDEKTKDMKPAQVTPTPILSTIEVKRNEKDTDPGKVVIKDQKPVKSISPAPSLGVPLAEIRNENERFGNFESKNTTIHKNAEESSTSNDIKHTSTDKDTQLSSQMTSDDNIKISVASSSVSHNNNRLKDKNNSKPSQLQSSMIKNQSLAGTSSVTTISNVIQGTINNGNKTPGTLRKTENQNSSTDLNKKMQPVRKIETTGQPDKKENSQVKTRLSDKNASIDAISVQKNKGSIGDDVAVAVTKPFILSATSKTSITTCTVTKLSDMSPEASEAKICAKVEEPSVKTKISSEIKKPAGNHTSQSAAVVQGISKNKGSQIAPAKSTKSTTKSTAVSKPLTTSVSTKPTITKKTKNAAAVAPNNSTKSTTNKSTKPAIMNDSPKSALMMLAPLDSTTTSTKLTTTTCTITTPTAATQSTAAVATSKDAKSSPSSALAPTISVKQPAVSTAKPITTMGTSAAKVPTISMNIAGSVSTTKTPAKVSSIPVTTKACVTPNASSISSATSAISPMESKNSGQK